MKDSLQVFKEEPGFVKLFTLFKDKYRSLGRMGGTVSIHSFTNEELESIAGFLGQSVDPIVAKGRISLLDFEKELSQTAFSDYPLIELLEKVLGESIFTKVEESTLQEQQEKEFLQKLRITNPEADWWWDWLESKPSDSRWIWSLYRQDSEDLMDKLLTIARAYQELPIRYNKYERISLFAQRTTGNPHCFDLGQLTGRLLLCWMQVDQQSKGLRFSGMPKTAEEVNELLTYYGVMRDDLWSFVTCRGLLAELASDIHPVWKAACDMNTVLNVPLKELVKVDRIWPHTGKKVWIVENSSVCSTIMDEISGAPIICTHGQFRVASWIMLDKLVEAGCQLFYSGDLDPEGILMAQRLKSRYDDRVTIWRMDINAYEITISDEDISNRLPKIESITAVELVDVVKVLNDRKKAGYQEGIVELLIEDIRRDFLYK
jgi:uncharacterized protein (TIGR02679 family)